MALVHQTETAFCLACPLQVLGNKHPNHLKNRVHSDKIYLELV